MTKNQLFYDKETGQFYDIDLESKEQLKGSYIGAFIGFVGIVALIGFIGISAVITYLMS